MSELSYSYFPGCSGSGTSIEYEKSSRAVCEALGVKLVEIPDWSCCGSTPAHTVDHGLSAALGARNFAQAELTGQDDVLTPCPSCLKNLHNSLEYIESQTGKAEVEEMLGHPLQRPHSVSSVLQILVEKITPEEVAKKVKKPLTGLRLAPYYGCLMTRPGRSMKFDDEENPTSIDRLMEALGAEVVPFPLKVNCCGGSYGIPRPDVVARLTGRLLQMADSLGADAVVVACPLCQMNLDLRQGQANAALHMHVKLPVFYYTQLMGIALGVDESKLALDKLVVDPAPALAKIGSAPAGEKAAQAAPAKSAPQAESKAANEEIRA